VVCALLDGEAEGMRKATPRQDVGPRFPKRLVT
jgi:hypothetical protein